MISPSSSRAGQVALALTPAQDAAYVQGRVYLDFQDFHGAAQAVALQSCTLCNEHLSLNSEDRTMGQAAWSSISAQASAKGVLLMVWQDFLFHARLLEAADPGQVCAAEPWGYTAPPVDIFACAVITPAWFHRRSPKAHCAAVPLMVQTTMICPNAELGLTRTAGRCWHSDVLGCCFS